MTSSSQKARDAEAWGQRPTPSKEVLERGEACTPHSNRSRKIFGSAPRPQNVYSVRKKSLNVKTPLRFDHAADELVSKPPTVPAIQAYPPAGQEAQVTSLAKVVPTVASHPAKFKKGLGSVTHSNPEQSRESRSPESSNSEEEQVDRIESHAVKDLTKKRTVAHHLGDLEEPEAQHDVEDRPSPKKKRKTKQKVRRRMPVNELITGPERLEPISDLEGDIRRTIEADPVSEHSSSNSTPRRAKAHRRAKKQKRQKPSRREPKELVSIKFSHSKGFQIDIRKFRDIKRVTRSIVNDSSDISDGFAPDEMKLTGKTLPTKRNSGRFTIQCSVGPKSVPHTNQLTIVTDKPSDNDDDGSNMKKRKKKSKTFAQKQPEVHLKPTQNSGIATPPTIQKKSKPPQTSSSTLSNLGLVVQNVTAAILEHSGSGAELPRSPPSRQNVESNSQQDQSKITKSVSLLKLQCDREEVSNVTKELSMVIIVEQPDSDSDDSSEEDDQESDNDGDESNENKERDKNSRYGNEFINLQFEGDENLESLNLENSNVGGDFDKLRLGDNESDQSDKENHEVVDEEDVESEAAELEEDETGNEQGLAQEIVHEAEAEVEQEAEQEVGHDGEVEARQYIEVEEDIEDEEEQHPPSWQPRKPDAVVETEDEIQSSSPVRPWGRSYRSYTSRTPSRVYPQLPAVLRNAADAYSRQGSIELGDSQFQRRREIPETQMDDMGEEPEVPFSQVSYEPESSYFNQASQDLRHSPRKLSLRTKDMPPPHIPSSMRTSSLGGPKQTVSRQHSLLGYGGKSLKDITNRTNSQFGIQGSVRKKRSYSVGLLSQTFRV